MLRGQAEVISTVIIVGVAVALALGVIYYLTPLLAQNRAYAQLNNLLSQVSAATSAGLVYQEYDNVTLDVVVSVSYTGGGAPSVSLYAALIALNSDGLPVAAVNASWYRMNGSVAAATGSTGWVSLDALGSFVVVSPEDVYMFVGDGFYPLGRLSSFNTSIVSVKLAYLGLIGSGDSGIYRAVATGIDPALQYVVSVFVLANGRFYEVSRVVLEPLG